MLTNLFSLSKYFIYHTYFVMVKVNTKTKLDIRVEMFYIITKCPSQKNAVFFLFFFTLLPKKKKLKTK